MQSRNASHANRIFVSYRRSDARGYAGRLEDSLKSYFGRARVFRDVNDISPGDDFTARISASLGETGAMVVLIGPDWLVANEHGTARVHEQNDYVAEEIASALESGLPVFPVLIEGASMPREEDLPERLKPLSRRNAITVSDERWGFDVTRLARIIGLDVSGSVMERRLALVKAGLMLVLTASVLLSTLSFGRMAAATSPLPVSTRQTAASQPAVQDGDAAVDWFLPREASLNFIVILLAGLVLVATRTWVARASRRFLWAAAGVGFLGTLASFGYYNLYAASPERDTRHVVLFCASTILITIMLALTTLSGFTPNDSIE